MPIKTVNSETLKQWLANGEAVVVDVREPAEHSAENIKGAKLVPLATVSKNKLPDCCNKKLVVHCRSGGRSTKACEKLLAEDPNLEIYNLEGGISAWSGAGNEVGTSGKFFLPLDRQVQLTVGLSVFIGSALTYFVNHSFLVIPAFFGAGLTFAGATGFCGLAMLLAKMPWNQKTGISCVTTCSVK
ncbi:MAG TPA: rhodanese [Alphaproteobacteria bacterium]|nr:rhodanese [Alphaproteobacteria bacterium]